MNLDKNNLRLIEHNAKVWFTSDTHFGHDNRVLLHSKDPTPVPERDQKMIDAINQYVQPEDVLYFVGDFAICEPDHAQKCFEAIHCKNKHLIIGNHDQEHVINLPFHSKEYLLNTHMKSLHNGEKFEIDLSICHYPLVKWHGDAFGVHHIHGHIHDWVLETEDNMTLVDIVQNGYKPLALHDIYLKNKEYQSKQEKHDYNNLKIRSNIKGT